MKHIKKINKRILIPLSLLVLAVVGMSVAYYSSQKDFYNALYTGGVPGVAINERFDPTDLWLPEEEKSKQVWFENTGQLDMYLRFTVDVQWEGGSRDEKIKDTDKGAEELSEVIKLNFRASSDSSDPIILPGKDDIAWGESWVVVEEEGKREFSLPQNLSDIDCSSLLTPVLVKEGDKATLYYYYNEVLKAGGSTERILESVEFDKELSNDGHYHSDYSDIQINITVNGETVLANKDEAKAKWSMTVEESGDTIKWTK